MEAVVLEANSETAVSASAMNRVRVNPLRFGENLVSAQKCQPIKGKTGDYRADIDGLRAIAVLLVLLFHGGSSVFSSGFIGVDVFFVISGFLITSIVLKDLSANTFTFAKFYTRRAWRLQPAMIAVYVATLAVALLIYLPDDFVDYLKSTKYATMFLSNQYFARTTTAYAADDTSSLLLLHTWSLAIEWQWYFLLPACLVALHKKASMSTIRFIVPVLTVLAALFALRLSSSHPTDNYYSFISRIFELLIGACVVILNGDKLKLGKGLASVLGLSALSVIVYCSTRTGILRGFPDYHAVLVCVATATLLIRDVGEKGVHGLVTSSLLPRSLGKVSYSLYLWHWPVLAVTAYLGLTGTAYSQAVYYIGSVLLAVVSYSVVEKRLRRVKLGSLATLVILVIIPAVLFSVAYKVADSKHGFPQRFGSEYAASQKKLRDYNLQNRPHCIEGVTDESDPRCVVGDIHSTSRALMIGDSFSNQYMAFMDVLGKDSGLAITALSSSACLALPDIYLYNWWKFKDDLYYRCHDRAVAFYDLIKANHYKYVVLGQIWANYAGDSVVHELSDERTVELSRARVEASMRNALGLIIQTGATPVIIKAVQTMPSGVNECLSQHLKMRDHFGSTEVSAGCTTTAENPKDADWFETLFVSLKRDFPTLRFIDPKDVQCELGECATEMDGVPMYRDVGHITDFASHKLGDNYLKKYGNPLDQIHPRMQ
jgi:peptidoglycan/LPS O-acetylase OafA/YrhL